MSDVIYQSSDLAGNKRTEFIRDAKHGGARLRDRDGESLLFIPESKYTSLQHGAEWSRKYLHLSRVLEEELPLTPSVLGDLAWLRVFSGADLREFLRELHEALIASLSDESSDSLDSCIEDWRTTARQLEDPLRREVLLEQFDNEDFAEAVESEVPGSSIA